MSSWTVYILDSSGLLRIKHDYPAGDQFDICVRIKSLIELGRAAFPRQVHREVARVRHPDTPGSMIDSVHAAGSVQFPEPDDETLRKVLAEAPLLQDWDAIEDPADAYVAAMAVEINAVEGLEAVVVTLDVIDRPEKTSLATACERLGVKHVSLQEFLDADSGGDSSLEQWREANNPQLTFDSLDGYPPDPAE